VAAIHVAGVRGDPCGAVRWTELILLEYIKLIMYVRQLKLPPFSVPQVILDHMEAFTDVTNMLVYRNVRCKHF